MQQQPSTQVVMPEEINADFTMARMRMPNISRPNQARSIVRPGRCLQAVLMNSSLCNIW